MADDNFILAPPTVKIDFDIDPVIIALDSLMLISSTDRGLSGVSEWVNNTAAALTPQQRHDHELLIHLMNVLEPDRRWPTVPDFIAHLQTVDAQTMRDESMETMCFESKFEKIGMAPLSQAELLAERELFTRYHRQQHEWFAQENPEHASKFDEALLNDLYDLLVDPPALKAFVIQAFTRLWDELLADDWQRSQPVLRESVEAFRQMDYSGLNYLEAIRIITGRDMIGYKEDKLSKVSRIIFTPSVHIGPYIRVFSGRNDDEVYLIFGARVPEGMHKESPALSRSELLVRLSALTDDTRLQILELLTHHDELCAQDIMTMLDLSQSSTSRHLRQLTATGYLIERRREVAKCYSLNAARFEDTIQALKQFISVKAK